RPNVVSYARWSNVSRSNAARSTWSSQSGLVRSSQTRIPRLCNIVGGVISPVLANLTLNGLETLLRERFPQLHEKSHTKVNLVRFADDFIITGDSKELLEQDVKPLVETFMKERGLELSTEKTVITHIAEGFDFLGQNIRKYDGKLLIKPSKRSVKRVLSKVRTLVQTHKQAKAGNLILQLNR